MLDEVFSADNIFDFIEFARKVECHHLQALVCGFFLKHLDVVVNSDRFLKLSAESIHTLLVAGSATNELALQMYEFVFVFFSPCFSVLISTCIVISTPFAARHT